MTSFGFIFKSISFTIYVMENLVAGLSQPGPSGYHLPFAALPRLVVISRAGGGLYVNLASLGQLVQL